MHEKNEANERLIAHLKKKKMITSSRVEQAFRSNPRGLFVRHGDAYEDVPLPTAQGQTVSQPSVVARMTEMLAPQTGNRVLEIGTGSGWQTAILCSLVGPEGLVYTLERIAELTAMARENLKRAGCDRVKVINDDGSVGCKRYAPYNRLICTAATPEIPEEWIEQLAQGGRIVAPVGKEMAQTMLVAEKDNGGLSTVLREDYYRFVPLRGEKGY